MIRDEFLKQEKKNVKYKEMGKIRSMGGRAFYTSQINKLKALNKSFVLTSWITLVSSLLIVGIIIATILVKEEGQAFETSFYVYCVIAGVMLLFSISWLLIVRPILNNTVVRYQKALKEISDADLEKKRKAYENIILPNQKKEQTE